MISINELTGDIYRYDHGTTSWEQIGGGGSGTDYMGMIGEGAPGTRSDGSALLTGDHYFEGKEHYYYTAYNSSWNPANQVVRVGSSAPGGNFRISGQAAVTGDLYINTTDDSLGYFDGSSWTAISSGGSGGSYYMGMTSEGGPGTRPDGSALVVGDHFVDNSVFAKNVENYWWSGSAWLSSSNVIIEGSGAPSSTSRFTGAALVENDFYIDETNAALYRWDSSAWQLLGGGGGVNTDGSSNTWAGTTSSITTGSGNTAYGANALNATTDGDNNIAIGSQTLNINTSGSNNVAVGVQALQENTTGGNNIAVGPAALQENTTGGNNTAVGTAALYQNTLGEFNVGVGLGALENNTMGIANTAVGAGTLMTITTGSGNIGIGHLDNTGVPNPVVSVSTQDNTIVFGHTAITNAYTKVSWSVVSDARDKMNFAPVPHGLEFVNQLEPTAYQFKVNRDTETPSGDVRYGFKAQDILALEGDNPVIIDANDANQLMYKGEHLVPILVNSIQELTAMVKDLQSEVAALKGE